jgi:hypothetical protein
MGTGMYLHKKFRICSFEYTNHYKLGVIALLARFDLFEHGPDFLF